jgi:hypothetical protein
LSLADCGFRHLATTSACGLSGVLVGFLFALTDRTPDNHSMTFPFGSLHSLTVVCVVLELWQWKNDLISVCNFYGYSGMEKRFCVFLVCIFLVFWQWKNIFFYLLFLSALYGYSGKGKMI